VLWGHCLLNTQSSEHLALLLCPPTLPILIHNSTLAALTVSPHHLTRRLIKGLRGRMRWRRGTLGGVSVSCGFRSGSIGLGWKRRILSSRTFEHALAKHTPHPVSVTNLISSQPSLRPTVSNTFPAPLRPPISSWRHSQASSYNQDFRLRTATK
jgi:hypothetical protein